MVTLATWSPFLSGGSVSRYAVAQHVLNKYHLVQMMQLLVYFMQHFRQDG